MNHEMQIFLETKLAQGRQDQVFPSAACAIGVRDTLLAEAFVGEAPLPGDAPVTEDTLYDMASLSKIIGPTMIVLRKMASGELGLQEKVGDFFPEAPEDKRDITIEMLMTHTGGFQPSFRLDQMLDSPAKAVGCILSAPLGSLPGERTNYSCMGYILLAKMLEKRFGMPLDQLARQEVFQPLGLTHTGYCPPASAQCAATERDPKTGRPWIGIVHDENARFLGGVSGNAGVFMPLKDGIRFASMLAQMGKGYLPESLMREAIRNRTPGQEQHRGLGFHLAGTPDCFFSNQVPDSCFGHTGFTGTSLMIDPATGFYVLLLTNRVYPTRETTKLFPFRRQIHAQAYSLFIKTAAETMTSAAGS